MLTETEAISVANLFYKIDCSVRNDLYNYQVSSEPDYVSRMCTHFNYPFGILNLLQLGTLKFETTWQAKVHDKSHEQKFGCDSMIVFQFENQIKVGMFEAKWPRVFPSVSSVSTISTPLALATPTSRLARLTTSPIAV